MSLSAVNLPCPTTDGAGAAGDTSALAQAKTIIVSGEDFDNSEATLLIQATGSTSGNDDWITVVSTSQRGVFYTSVVARRMRVVVEGLTGGVAITATVDVAAEAATVSPTFLQINRTIGNGRGTLTNVSAYPDWRTIFVTGTFTGAVSIEGSNDGLNYFPIYPTATAPTSFTMLSPVRYLSVVRTGVDASSPGLPTIWLGAVAPGSSAGGVTFPLNAGAGSVSAPSIYWGDANTGVFAAAAGLLDITCDGTRSWSWTAGAGHFPAGTVGTPGLSPITDTDTGFYLAGNNTIGVSANGAQVATFGIFGVSTIADINNPAFNCVDDTSTGLAVDVGFCLIWVNGVPAMNFFQSDENPAEGAMAIRHGSADSPSLRFTQGGAGFFSDAGGNKVSVSTSGTEKLQVDGNTTASQTALLVSVAGAAVQRVKVGAAGSAGTGLRALAVDN